MRATERYLAGLLELDPILATELGEPLGQDRLPDFSPAGEAARAALARDALEWIAADDTLDPVARDLAVERLETELALYEAGEHEAAVNVIASPQHAIKQAFDLMRIDTPSDVELVAERLGAVPEALAGYRATLEAGLANGHRGQRRQALAAAALADETAAHYFEGLRARLARALGGTAIGGSTEDRLRRAAQAYADLGSYLRDDYAPRASERDGVGRERWELWCRAANGRLFDPVEAVAWAVAERERLLAELEREARLLGLEPGPGLPAALDAIDAYRIEGVDAFLRWNQGRIDRAMEVVTTRVVSLPTELRRCEALEAPPGGAAAMYYTPPSSDLSRPGRTWYPTRGQTSFSLWSELTTVHHESVPGHHLQTGIATWRGGALDPFQRVLGAISGHVEGWALYAERLADELGLLDDPAYRIGHIYSQLFRTARILVDVGLHVGVAVDLGAGATETLTPSRAIAYLVDVGGVDDGFAASEVDRYLGWPAQATSYKLGERVWLEARAAARRRGVDDRTFHETALNLGFISLDQLLAVAETIEPAR